jgi:hypothetical protein
MRAWLPLSMVLVLAGSATAAPCTGAAGEPEPAEVEARLARLGGIIDREVRDLHIWSWTWGSIYAAATLTQVGLAIGLRDPPTRIDLGIGAVSAGLGSVLLYVLPLRFTLPLSAARAKFDGADRCQVLIETEATLAAVASEEGIGKSWLGHVGGALVNVALTLILGLGYHQWRAGLITGGIGLAIGELNLWTQPTRLGDELKAYRAPVVRFFPLLGEVRGAGLALSF